jgi:hypothetical protein
VGEYRRRCLALSARLFPGHRLGPGCRAPHHSCARSGQPRTTPAPAQGKPGAPWLDCNLWLLGSLEQLQDPTANTHLEGEYLRRHYDETGIDLVVPHRDFQKAAARCIKVIRARRRDGS